MLLKSTISVQAMLSPGMVVSVLLIRMTLFMLYLKAKGQHVEVGCMNYNGCMKGMMETSSPIAFGLLGFQMISQEALKEHINYNTMTGAFVWIKKTHRSSIKTGAIAGYIDNTVGYRRITILGTKYLAHRLAWLYLHGSFPPFEIDHINHIKDDNRICNLRAVSRQGNCKNMSIRCDNTSDTSGVSLDKRSGRWVAYIHVDNKRKQIGYYDDFDSAVKARRMAEIKHGYMPEWVK